MARILVAGSELPDLAQLPPHERRDWVADTHYATPLRALALAAAVARLPAVVRIVGCQPAATDRFEIGLHPAVEAAMPEAVRRILDLLTNPSSTGIRPSG